MNTLRLAALLVVLSPHVARAADTVGATAPIDADPPLEIGLFGLDVLLMDPPVRPAEPVVLAPPARPASYVPSGPAVPDAEIRAWIRTAGGPDPAAAAAAQARLADVPPRPLLSNALWALRDRDPAVRLGGVAALRAHGRPEAVGPLASRVLYEPDVTVRGAMATALGAIPDPKGEGESYLRNKILTGDRATRLRTAEVMGETGKRVFVEILVHTYTKITGRSNRAHIFVGTQGRYIDDFDVQVTAGAFALDPHIGTIQYGIVLDTTVLKIEEQWQEIERRVILAAIDRLGGVAGAAGAPPPARRS